MGLMFARPALYHLNHHPHPHTGISKAPNHLLFQVNKIQNFLSFHNSDVKFYFCIMMAIQFGDQYPWPGSFSESRGPACAIYYGMSPTKVPAHFLLDVSLAKHKIVVKMTILPFLFCSDNSKMVIGRYKCKIVSVSVPFSLTKEIVAVYNSEMTA